MAKVKSETALPRWVPVVKSITVIVTLALIGLGCMLILPNYVMIVGGRPVLLNQETVDLRDAKLTVAEYEALSAKMADKEILWSVPIGGDYHESSSEFILLSHLEEEQLVGFRYLPNLKTVDARDCPDHEALIALQQAYPNLDVQWAVHLGGRRWSRDTESLDLREIPVTAEELLNTLGYFAEGTQVRLSETGLTDQERKAVTEAFPGLRIHWGVELMGKIYSSGEKKLSFAGKTVDLDALTAAGDQFSSMEEIDLTGCGVGLTELAALQEAYPGAKLISELELFGKQFHTLDEEIDLSGIEMKDTQEVELAAKVMPALKKVDMCGCGISNEDMDALNKRHEGVKFVWTVKIGKADVRTDIVGFIGAKYGYIPNANIRNPYEDRHRRLFDEDCVNFKYCTDIVVMDLGHMGVTDYSFLEYMPNLKYLLLADTQGTDFSVLAKLENLIYLELFMTEFTQTELLLNLTKLENLNLGFLHLQNPDVLKEMKWLKMLWIPGTHLSNDKYQEIVDALPDTVVNTHDVDSTSSGWRKHQNYYDMRDILDIYYLQ